jgi:AraC-like DNA-binding protein
VPGIQEVFHARFAEHAYPRHTHEAWTLLIVDRGTVRYGLDRREHGTGLSWVSLLPPHVPHDGRPATPAGFTKRVLYLDGGLLDRALVGRAVDGPTLADPLLRRRIAALHGALAGAETVEAVARLALVTERLEAHLRGRVEDPLPVRDPGVARRLRELIDATAPDDVALPDAAARFGVSTTHLIRAFSREFGLSPHRYLTGRRVDLARRLLLAGLPPADVAARSGFYDQPHLTRHFRRALGTTPGSYAAGGAAQFGR